METEKYMHHGRKVSVQKMLRGKHRYHCLCYGCKKFTIKSPADVSGRVNNCPISNAVYALCVLEDLVLPVWECPEFEMKV